MKVVFITMFPPNQGGGAGMIAREIATAFAKNGTDTAIIHSDQNRSVYKDEDGLVHCTLPSTNSQKSLHEGHPYTQPSFSPKNLEFLYTFLEDFNPDLIHAHDPVNISLLGQVWAIRNEVPYFYTTHVLPEKALDFGGADSIPNAVLPTLRLISKQYFTQFLNNTTAIVALNDSALKSNIDFGLKRDKIEVIPNGRNLSNYTGCSFADINSKEKRLCFIGHISPRKNQEFLIESIKHLPKEYKLTLVGAPLQKQYLDNLKRKTPNNIKDRITFKGQLSHDQIPNALAQSHVFVSAAKLEVQSLVIIEALASGTPVVGLSNETVDELIDEEVGYALNEDASPQEFASQILKLSQLTQEEYLQKCQNARQRVQDLDWPRIVKKTIEMYKKYIGKNKTLSGTKKRSRINKLIKSFSLGQKKFTKQLKNLLDGPTSSATDSTHQSRDDKTSDNSPDRNSNHPKASDKSPLKPDGTKAQKKRVPPKTFLFAGITVITSILIYLGWKSLKGFKETSKKLNGEKEDK